MPSDLDAVARFALGDGLTVGRKTILVEGRSDEAMFALAAELEFAVSGTRLCGPEFAITACGDGDRAGVRGVVRQLVALRAIGSRVLLPNGRPQYRFVALFDNDNAGRRGVSLARDLDLSLLEYKDLFCLRPHLPICRSADPRDVRVSIESANSGTLGIDWELEDLFPSEFVAAFLEEEPFAIVRETHAGRMVHREFSADGKAKFHRFVKQHAMHSDVAQLLQAIRFLRSVVGLPAI